MMFSHACRWAVGGVGLAAIAIASLATARPLAAQPICGTEGEPEPAAETLRTVELPQFDLAVQIPSNYRTMLLNNGTVQILHPQDFEFLRCIARGGRGGRGYYSESIRTVPRDSELSLREQASQIAGGDFTIPTNDGNPRVTEIAPYEQEDFSGYLIVSPTSYVVTFVGEYPQQPEQLLVVEASCDCEVDREALTDLLSRIERLE